MGNEGLRSRQRPQRNVWQQEERVVGMSAEYQPEPTQAERGDKALKCTDGTAFCQTSEQTQYMYPVCETLITLITQHRIFNSYMLLSEYAYPQSDPSLTPPIACLLYPSKST